MPNGDRVISIRPNDPNYGEASILLLPSVLVPLSSIICLSAPFSSYNSLPRASRAVLVVLVAVSCIFTAGFDTLNLIGA